MRTSRSLRSALLLPALLSAGVAELSAQCGSPSRPCGSATPRWRGEVVTGTVNAALGGLTSGLLRRARGGSFRQGFVTGAAGGAATYAGKRVTAERWAGAGLLGRQVAAVGSSVTRNAAEGRPALDRVVLPLGPVRVYLAPRGPSPLRARLDLAAVVVAGYTAFQPDTRFDAAESLSSGALVFRRHGDPREVGWNGAEAAGVVLVRAGVHPAADESESVRERMRSTLAHERVHVAQYDQTFLLWSAPGEEALLRGAGWTRAVGQYVDLSLNAPVWAGINAVFPYEARPWEDEAYFLSRTRTERPPVEAAGQASAARI